MIRKSLIRATALVTCLLIALVAMADSARPTMEKIGSEVQCLCGCNAPLNGCPHFECAEKAQMQTLIRKDIADGKDEAAILQDLSKQFGVRVLSTPPAHGINLSIWILPPLGLLLGLVIVIVIARRWKKKPPTPPPSSPVDHDPKVLSAMEEEMKSVGLK